MSRLLFREPFAVVPLASDRFFDEADLNEQRIPYVGVGSQPAFCGVENGFGFAVTGASGCPVLDAIGIATSGPVLQAYLAGTGIAPAELRVAHIVGSSVAGQETAAARRLEVESVGATLVIVDSTLRLAALASDADLRNVAEGVLAAQPDVIIVEVDGGDRVYRFLREAGFSGDIVGVGYDPLQALTDQDIRARQAGTFQVVPGRAVVPQDTDEWDKLIDDARRVELSAEFVGLGFVSGYASMDFFLAALAEVEEPVSRERFHDLVNRGWEYPGIEGVVCASSWPTAHLLAAPCASMVFINSDGAPEVVLPATMFQLIMEEQR